MRPASRASQPRARLVWIVGVLLMCGTVVVARAAYMQLWAEDKLQAAGDERFLREVTIATTRGMITDRNGEPLAVSSPVESVWVNPKELMANGKRVPELAKALDIPVQTLTRKLAQRKDKQFMYLRRHMNPDDAKAVIDLGIHGVYSSREFRRFYPHREVMAQLIGTTNLDEHGVEGLEKVFDDWLTGTPGKQKIIRDRRGRIVENIDLIRPAENGKDLVLSIDRRIQYLAYSELKQGVIDTRAKAGTAVVLDVRTGEVLAMVSYPSFNPNARSGVRPETRRNKAVTDVVEPGSTMKPLTVAAALEAGKITPETIFNTNPGWIPNGKYRTTDTHNYGVLDTTGVIRKSSNVGAAMIVHRLTNQDFYDFMRRFGYGATTGSGFPGESPGFLPPPPLWSGTSKQTMSYGYGLSVTPLQLAHAYAALGNDGRAITPTFVKGGKGESKQVLDPKVAHEIMKMMQTVTEPGGTATQAAVRGYHVAGKTGTARMADGGGYSRRYNAFFAGMVPVDNPRFSMVVVLQDPDPSLGYTGGVVSAPVFKNVMEGSLRLLDVPPDNIEQWYAARAPEPVPLPGPDIAQAPPPETEVLQ
jgi:cell division protein FtsI (penicillin-binding protein 3)